MLEKRLELGGLQVGYTKTVPNTARFSVAHNCYQTADNVYVPKFGKVEDSSIPSGYNIINLKIFQGLPFIVARKTSDWTLAFFYNGVKIPDTFDFFTYQNIPSGAKDLSFGMQFFEVNTTLYFNVPVLGLFKFDGLMIRKAGVPTSYGGVASGIGAATWWFRLVMVSLDYQGNRVYSGYTEGRLLAQDMNLYLDSNADSINGSIMISPSERQPFDNISLGFGDYQYVIKNGTIPTLEADGLKMEMDSHNLKEGVWVQGRRTIPLTIDQTVGAVRVNKISGDFVWFDKAKIHNGMEWEDEVPTTMNNVPARGGSFWIAVYISDQQTGNYVLKDLVLKGESSSITMADLTTPVGNDLAKPLNLAPIMGDFYDVTSVKTPFPCLDKRDSSASMTTFQGNFVIAGAQEIFFSDTTLGGSVEMTSGFNSASVGEQQYGPLCAVCGSEDFLFVSRRFKNYVLSGNLHTANYSVKALTETSIGAYSNESVFSLGGNVLFLNRAGVWMVSSSGKVDRISRFISGLFESYSETFKQSFVHNKWNLDGYATHVIPELLSSFDEWVKVRFDAYRNLVHFFNAKGQSLVLNLNNGEFTTMDFTATADFDFYEGKAYTGEGTKIYKEDKTVIPDNSIELVPTFLTAGEPSLDKKITQIKLWGRIVGNLELTNYSEWRFGITDRENYESASADWFGHLVRIKSFKAQAGSIGIKVLDATRFELDGIEIEFSVMQEGVKR